jgi:hypothetical protein
VLLHFCEPSFAGEKTLFKRYESSTTIWGRLFFLEPRELSDPSWQGSSLKAPRTIAVLPSNLLAPRCDGHFCS